MQDEHYNGNTKNMKSAPEINMQLESLSPRNAQEYLGVVHDDVFRIAGKGGLINPADLDVSSNGLIGLTKSALCKVYLKDKFMSYDEAVARWRKYKGTELSNKVRDLMNKHQSSQMGHKSLRSLRDTLRMTPENIHEALTEVFLETEKLVNDLESCIAICMDPGYPDQTSQAVATVVKGGFKLFADYGTRKLTDAAKIAWAKVTGDKKLPWEVGAFF
ncbi:hypothetical protein F53441_9964 [Fusarium austroafricanum]|uniref:Uncharacterized protein n=1 Tax=Fusarium austroafricanum TaxID=2364996 RepID=A0A8H4KAM6_9HYPO|nr:hypothetical protein F53441_9964 [Fusarium austroafricanum]